METASDYEGDEGKIWQQCTVLSGWFCFGDVMGNSILGGMNDINLENSHYSVQIDNKIETASDHERDED